MQGYGRTRVVGSWVMPWMKRSYVRWGAALPNEVEVVI
jgi:hypothetical protein